MYLNTAAIQHWDAQRLLALIRGEVAWDPNTNISDGSAVVVLPFHRVLPLIEQTRPSFRN